MTTGEELLAKLQAWCNDIRAAGLADVTVAGLIELARQDVFLPLPHEALALALVEHRCAELTVGLQLAPERILDSLIQNP